MQSIIPTRVGTAQAVLSRISSRIMLHPLQSLNQEEQTRITPSWDHSSHHLQQEEAAQKWWDRQEAVLTVSRPPSLRSLSWPKLLPTQHPSTYWRIEATSIELMRNLRGLSLTKTRSLSWEQMMRSMQRQSDRKEQAASAPHSTAISARGNLLLSQADQVSRPGKEPLTTSKEERAPGTNMCFPSLSLTKSSTSAKRSPLKKYDELLDRTK